MIKNSLKIVLSMVLITSLVACFDKAADENTPNNKPIDTSTNNNNDPVDNSGNTGDNNEPDTGTGNENNPNTGNAPVVVINKPDVPSVLVTGSEITVENANLDSGYIYDIYFSSQSFDDATKAAYNTSYSGGGGKFILPVATLGLNLAQDNTVFYRVRARDNLGNASELTDIQQIKLLAKPEAPDIASLGNEITLTWAAQEGKTYKVYYGRSNLSAGDTVNSFAEQVPGGPFSDGTLTFSAEKCPINVYLCSVALVAVDGNSQSAPVFVTDFNLVPLTPESPTLSTLGDDVTVTTSLSPLYEHEVYMAENDFSDISQAILLGKIGKGPAFSTNVWGVPAGMGLDLTQDKTLYVRVQAIDPNGNRSILSDVETINYLAPLSDIGNISSIGSGVTLEWAAQAGKSYNVYKSNKPIIRLNSARLETIDPITSGSFNISCDLKCSFAITVVDGDAESEPLLIDDFITIPAELRMNNSNRQKTGEQYIFSPSRNTENYRAFVSTTGQFSSDDVFYDSKIDGMQASVTHDIPSYYDVISGEAIVYNYGLQEYKTYTYTNAANEEKTFYAFSPMQGATVYTPAVNDFRLTSDQQFRLSGSSDIQIIDGKVFWAGNFDLINFDLNSQDSSKTRVSTQQIVHLLVEPTSPAVNYYITNSTLVKIDNGVEQAKISLSGDVFSDLVQTDTDLFILARKSVYKIAKASLTNGASLTEMLSGLSYASDIALSSDNSTLYIATGNGVYSIPTSGTFPVASANELSTSPASWLTLSNDTLYFVNKEANASIYQLPLDGSGSETVLKANVAELHFLTLIGDWLYFSTSAKSYRLSLLADAQLEKIADISATSLTVDTSPNGEGVYLTSEYTGYHFPESFFTNPGLPPEGVDASLVTVTAGDQNLTVNFAQVPDAEFYTINDESISKNNTANLEKTLGSLTNGIEQDIAITAYNISGASDPVIVSGTPWLVSPSIATPVKAGQGSGNLTIKETWPVQGSRTLTHSLYRSTAPNVDVSGATAPVGTTTAPDSGNLTWYQRDLIDGQLYYFRLVMDDGNVSSVSDEFIGLPYFYNVYPSSSSIPGGDVLTVDPSGNVYWAASYNSVWQSDGVNSSFMKDKNGADLILALTQLVADDDSQVLYATESDSNNIIQIQADINSGWSNTTFATMPEKMNQLIIDASDLYSAGAGKLYTVDLFDKNITNLYQSIEPISHLVDGGSYVYWVSGSGENTAIKRILKTGGDAELILTVPNIENLEVDFSSEMVFYSVANSGGFTIHKYDIANATTTIVTDKSILRNFAVNPATADVYAAVSKTINGTMSYNSFVTYNNNGVEVNEMKGVPGTPNLAPNYADTMNSNADLKYMKGSLYYLVPNSRVGEDRAFKLQ